jgi:beta-hydroxylase
MSNDTHVDEKEFQARDADLWKTMRYKAINGLDRLFGRYSLVGDRPVHDPHTFAWTRRLEDHWTVMRDELDALLQHREALPSFHDITEDAATISQDDKWKTYFFYGYGEKAEENCARCPRTTELIEQVPGMTTAFFSILSPGKHIPAHRGPYKGVLRYHLGLKVPEPAEKCRIRVDDQIVHWEEGESMVFDDTYNHEVWNETSGERAILFLDVKRPLPQPLSTVNDLILAALQRTSVVQDAQENQKKWSKRLEEAQAARSGASRSANGQAGNGVAASAA